MLYPEGIEASDLMCRFDICPCCSCEFGFDDTSAYRTKWIEAGCIFHSIEHQPPDWDPESQLRHADYSWKNPLSEGGAS